MIRINENINGVIDIYEKNQLIDQIIPDYDLDKSIDLLKKFNNTEIHNKKIYQIWKSENYYILPALQEWIFWDYFVPVVKYKKLFQKYNFDNIDFNKSNLNGYGVIGLKRYKRLIDKQPNIFLRACKKIIIYFLQMISRSEKLLVFDDGFKGFRYKRIKKEIFNNKKFTRIHLLTLIDFFSIFKHKAFCYGFVDIIKKRPSIPPDIFRELLKLDPNGFPKFLDKLETKSEAIINSVAYSKKILLRNNISKIFGYDQIEEILPLVIAAKSESIKVVTYQHGVITRFHSGWNAPGIPEKYCNLKADKIIVWGEFWKNNLLHNSNKYLIKDIYVGRHLNKNMIMPLENNSLKLNKRKKIVNLLYPFEFMANQINVEKYFYKFINGQAKITVKVRNPSINDPAGGNLKRDSLSYSEDIRNKLNFVYDLSEDEIKNYDAVICTQSTYALEMMKLNIPIWYLDTDLNFIDFITENKIAHKVRLNEAESIVLNKKDFIQYYSPRYDKKIYKELFNQDVGDSEIADAILS